MTTIVYHGVVGWVSLLLEMTMAVLVVGYSSRDEQSNAEIVNKS
jgi:hypothetical protein